ncbi:hypothetical protein NY2A_b822R [Paramecium bursaria Chlorella virus NY2A]|uniref:Uncharacterized protein b822R n=1 Tax=Paramecium bursaria Chlorella virus NY2A TaxID=46021 RepID=A7IXZ7_PBCVN|nr:hypothetical protein NY2A_b822R [Paramecium bursaria Chlorella virus NY2A]ABT15221.1 hypothetical protein NY2A_b822R [Paramecium bursaria Chlorella virus NY2A]
MQCSEILSRSTYLRRYLHRYLRRTCFSVVSRHPSILYPDANISHFHLHVFYRYRTLCYLPRDHRHRSKASAHSRFFLTVE